MQKVIEYLLSIGYICVRSPKYGYSSVVPGGIDSVYKKDNSSWIFGLNEKGYHPTLVYPRPIKKTSYEKDGLFYIYQYNMSDSEMHTYLNSKRPDEIFEELNSFSISRV